MVDRAGNIQNDPSLFGPPGLVHVDSADLQSGDNQPWLYGHLSDLARGAEN